MFKLIFSVLTSCVILSKKNKIKSWIFPKTMTTQQIEKIKGAKVEEYLEEHIERF